MTAPLYLLLTSAKNKFKELLRSPGKLTLYIVVIAAIAAGITFSIIGSTMAEEPAPIFWLTGIIFAFITLYVVLTAVKGLSGGDVIFEMNDVNLLFVSPVSPRKILLYGIVRMAKTAFFAGIFILFQVGIFANFGIGYSGVLITFAGFMLSMVVLTVLSLLIYSVTNGNPTRKRVVKCLIALLFLPLAAFLAEQYLQTPDIYAALEAAISSPFVRFFPVSGWTASGVTAFLSGEILTGGFFFGLNLLLGAGATAYILLSNPDYYEDTLVSTETMYEKQRAVAEGDINAAFGSRDGVKVKNTGISGHGASALFYKHLREAFRESRLGILTTPSLVFIAGAVALSFFLEDLINVLQILMIIQIFAVGVGRGLKETYTHYVYMIPETSFSKIIWSNMEAMFKTLVIGVLIFGISGMLVGAHISLVFACIVTYTLFSFLLLGTNYVFMRFTGANISMGLLIVLYYPALAIVMAPGLVPALIVGFSIEGTFGTLLALLILSVWELIAGVICFALSKSVLHNCDMQSLKPSK
jgi:hypothetical protein